MTELSTLWLPILLSSVIVFIVSSIVHMVMPWHKSDYKRLQNDDKIMDAMRPFNLAPGDYIVPCPSSMKDMKSPEYQEKIKKGPIMIFTIRPSGQMSMGKPLILWFLNSIVIGIFSAYIASRALPNGGDYLQVFRFVGASAFMGYSFALWQISIWYGRSWSTTIKSTIDGLIYALLTAGTFGWLWPHVS